MGRPLAVLLVLVSGLSLAAAYVAYVALSLGGDGR